MEVYALRRNQRPAKLPSPDHVPEDGFLWVILERAEAQAWREIPERLLNVRVLEQHLGDSLASDHRSYYAGTEAYDQVIFQGLAPDDRENLLDTRTAAFYLFDGLLVTIHSGSGGAPERIKERLMRPGFHQPESAFALMHWLIERMVSRFLSIREPLADALEALQDDLLDPDDPYDDWKSLLRQRKQARRLEKLSADQAETISAWREDTRLELTDEQAAKLSDLLKHVERVQHHATTLQSDIESAVQLHFSAISHRTNEIMRVLTIVSTIVLPLSLVAGIYGMNFQYMPELKFRDAYFITLGGMAAVAIVLLVFLHLRRWL